MSIIRKNKLPLFLLAVVMMLSAFYIIAPNNETAETGGSLNDVSPTYSYYAEERLNILEGRNTTILELENQIAGGDLSVVSITNILEEINKIYNLKNIEVELETQIVALGYDDVLVEQYTKQVNLGTASNPIYTKVEMVDVKVLAETMTVSEYVAINKIIKEKFGSDEYKVNVVLSKDE